MYFAYYYVGALVISMMTNYQVSLQCNDILSMGHYESSL